MIKTCIFLFFALLLSLDAQESVSLTLRQAEDLAIQNNYSLNASLHRLEQGYYGYKASKDYFVPSLQFSANANYGGRKQNGLDNALSLTQPLYDRSAYYSLKEAQIQWEQVRLDVQSDLIDLLFRVRVTYHEVILNQAHLEVDRTIIKIWEEELQRQDKQLQLGISIPYEVSQTRLNLKNSWKDLYETQKKIRASQLKLSTLLGLPPDTCLNLIENQIPLPPEQKINLEQWKKWAQEYNPELKRGQFDCLLAEIKIKHSKAERYPTFSLFADAGHNYVAQGYYQTNSSVGLSMNWNIYNRPNNQLIRQAREVRCEATCNYYQLELETLAEVHRLANEIEHAYYAYKNSIEGAHLAEEGLKIASEKHRAGALSSFEYREAIKSLHEAQQAVNQDKFDLRQSYDKLIQQSGHDLTYTCPK